MLHTVNKSPFDRGSLESCLKQSKEGSAILFIEDGVYGALNNTKHSDMVKQAMKSRKMYALFPDIEARGMQDKVIDGIKMIDYEGFIDLVVEQNTVQSWL